jgi:hypothetical protein
MNVTNEIEQLAWVILQTANRTQAKDSLVRLVVPRAEEVTGGLEPTPNEAELLAVEKYLLERGYVAPANIGLTWGTYTITPAGFHWLEEGLSERSPTERLRELADKPSEEAAFEADLRAELEEESRRMEEVEKELDRVRQERPGASETATGEQEGEESHSVRSRFQMASGRVPWWKRMFGG